MKRIIKIFLCFFVFFFINEVDALVIDETDIKLQKGKNASSELYVESDEEITKVNFSLVYSTYDVPAGFTVNPEHVVTNLGSISYSVEFSEPLSGKILLGTVDYKVVSNPKAKKGTINVHTGTAVTITNKTINLNSQTLTVKVTNESVEETVKEEVKTYNLLKEIQSNIVKINVLTDVFEYEVLVPDDIESLDLKAIAKEESYKVEISSQKLSEIKDDKITIKVVDNDKHEQLYTIKIKKFETNKIEIDKNEVKKDTSYKTKWTVSLIALIVFLIVAIIIFK